MFDHIGISVSDLDRSLRFYRAALAPLGYGVTYQEGPVAGLGKQDGPQLWLHGGKAGGPVHVALAGATRAEVQRFHAAALEAGGRDNGAPGLRPDYHATYYAAFALDPDGNNIEAVCHRAP